jgi:plasmid stabilization system protein ParE
MSSSSLRSGSGSGVGRTRRGAGITVLRTRLPIAALKYDKAWSAEVHQLADAVVIGRSLDVPRSQLRREIVAG